jgi:hypothetical protein
LREAFGLQASFGGKGATADHTGKHRQKPCVSTKKPVLFREASGFFFWLNSCKIHAEKAAEMPTIGV